ncbi:MAG: hemolysin III family protein [Candidatus Omnitrophota bacterium]
MKKNNQSLIEETANSITQGIALLLSIAGTVILIVLASRHGDIWRVTCFSIYGSTLIILYASSALYHSFPPGRLKHMLKITEYSAIYLFIAGSYTPFVLITLRGELGWTLFSIIWALALAGVIFKIFFIDRFLVLSTITYLAMGWLALIAVRPMINNFPFKGIVWLIAGGLLYTSGIIFHFSNKLPFHHAIWHLFVIGGSICHYLAILFYVLPA